MEAQLSEAHHRMTSCLTKAHEQVYGRYRAEMLGCKPLRDELAATAAAGDIRVQVLMGNAQDVGADAGKLV